jgi:hypothetical protein
VLAEFKASAAAASIEREFVQVVMTFYLRDYYSYFGIDKANRIRLLPE